MRKVKTKRRLSSDAWPTMVSRFESSGMSAEAFSQQERVSLASLKHWQQKLEQTRRGKAPVVSASQPQMAGFVDVGALSSSGTRVELRLDLGDGVMLTLSRG